MWIYLIKPLIGGVIGYITNDIAIKMLFRPRTPKYLFGKRIPFTPGMIPKEIDRVAISLGDSISKNLMNKEVIEGTLLSDDMIAKITATIDDFCEKQKTNTTTVKQFLSNYLSDDEVSNLTKSVSSEIKAQVSGTLVSSNLGKSIAAMAVKHAIEKVGQKTGGGSGLLGKIGSFFGGSNPLSGIFEAVAEPAERLLAEQIDEMLKNNSSQMVDSMVDSQTDKFLALPMSSLFVGREKQIEEFKSFVLSVYKKIVSEHLPKILATLNISNMIQQRIKEMDMAEVERLIYEVVDKELKAIVWFGAALGAALGCINIFL